MRNWKRRLIAAMLGFAVLLAAVWLICYYVAGTPMNATRRVREFLTSEANTRERPANLDHYFFHAYRIGERAWGVSYGWKSLRPYIPATCFVDRHHRVFHPESKELSALLKEELRPRRGDEAFIKRFLLLLNGESYTVLETLPDAVMATLALDAGEKIQRPAWLGNHTYRFYAHQKIGGIVYRCVFHYGEDGSFQSAGVTRLGSRVEPCLIYE